MTCEEVEAITKSGRNPLTVPPSEMQAILKHVRGCLVCQVTYIQIAKAHTPEMQAECKRLNDAVHARIDAAKRYDKELP